MPPVTGEGVPDGPDHRPVGRPAPVLLRWLLPRQRCVCGLPWPCQDRHRRPNAPL